MNEDAIFLAAVNAVLGPNEEGGYVNDPNDPGGETKFGISKRAHPTVDIANLTRDGAIEIYWTEYWSPAVENLPVNASAQFKRCAFECAINQGLGTLARLLPPALGQLSWFMAERAMAYVKDPNFDRYGNGWMRRLFAEMEV